MTNLVTQLQFALADAQGAIDAALGWLTSDVDTARAIEILRAARKGPAVETCGAVTFDASCKLSKGHAGRHSNSGVADACNCNFPGSEPWFHHHKCPTYAPAQKGSASQL